MSVFSNQTALQPHRSRYWLNAKTKTVDPLAFAEQVETICSLYAYAPFLHALAGHIVSCGEMSGVQALERSAPTQPMRPGRPERREFEATWAMKGATGILRSLSSRAAFLSDPSHRIQFVYVPKHTPWLNQVEMWFSILVRRVIKRGNFRRRVLAVSTQ